MIWILVVIYVLIIVLEVPPLMKNRMYHELGAFVIVFAIGLYMSLAFYYEWPLSGFFEAIIKPMEMK